MRYRTTIALVGRNTGIPVPDDVVEALGAGRRPPVRVTVGGHTYRSSVATMNGQLLIALSADNRAAAGVEGGQEVDVDVELDTESRAVAPPEDLAAALAAVPGAREAFDRLAPSHQKEHVRSVEEAKKPETRERRIAKVVAAVS